MRGSSPCAWTLLPLGTNTEDKGKLTLFLATAVGHKHRGKREVHLVLGNCCWAQTEDKGKLTLCLAFIAIGHKHRG
eukprot:1140452-Pelagomonas_calceolata.AAC.2